MIKVIGAGLAGCEAAWYLARRGEQVELIEQKPLRRSPAHTSDAFCELVCSNSLKGADPLSNACGLLKEELRRLGSLTMEAADATRVPAGGALAVDRTRFSDYVTQKLRAHPNVHIVCREETALPAEGIVATGPLTDGALYAAIAEACGGALHFYDATAPVVAAESVDAAHVFTADRYGRGTGDYWNCPLTKEEYGQFVDALLAAERVTLHAFEKREIFEGCMPIEVMAARGRDALRFGTLKPVGLADGTGRRPYAVLQLRRENAEGTLLGLVGCQTNLKFGEQRRVFGIIPALRHAEFERYGVMHRNTFLDAPNVLAADLSAKDAPLRYYAGQITGVEGYVESAMSGLISAMLLLRKRRGKAAFLPEDTCVTGALCRYLTAPNAHFQPMNANYGILRAIEGNDKNEKQEKRRLIAARALEEIERFRAACEA